MELPEHIVNKIMLYVSHPVADLFKRSFTWELHLLKEDRSNFFQAWRINNCDFNESEDEDDDDDDDALFLRTPPPRIQLQNAANDHDEDHEDDKYRVDDDSRDADSNLSARAAPFFPTFVIIHRYLNHERRCVLVCDTSNLMCVRVTYQI